MIYNLDVRRPIPIQSLKLGVLFCIGAIHSFADSYAYTTLCCDTPTSIATYSTNSGYFGPSLLVPPGAYTMARTPNGSELWVLTQIFQEGLGAGANGLTVVDPATGMLLAQLALSEVPYSIAFNHAGTLAYIAAIKGENRGHILVIDVAKRKILRDVAAPEITVLSSQAVAISPDDSTVYIADEVEIAVLNAKTLQLDQIISLPQSSRFGVNIAFAGNTLLVAYAYQLAALDIATNALTNLLTTTSTATLAVSPDGTKAYLLTIAAPSSVIQILDVASGQVTGAQQYEDLYKLLAVSPDGTTLAAVSSRIATIDASTLAIRNQEFVISPSAGVQFAEGSTVAYILFGDTLYGGTSLVSVIDQMTGGEVARIPVGYGSYPVITDSKHRYVFAGTQSGTSVIDPKLNRVIATFPTQTSDFPFLDIITVARDQIYSALFSVFSFNMKTNAMVVLPAPAVPQGSYPSYNAAAASPDGLSLYITFQSVISGPPPDNLESNDQTNVAIYDTTTNQLATQLRVPYGGAIAFSPRGAFAYIGGRAGTDVAIYLVDNANRTVAGAWEFPGSSNFFTALCISPDGHFVYALNGADVLKIDASTGRAQDKFALPPQTGSVENMAISDDGDTLFLTGGASVVLMSTATGSTSLVNLGQPAGAVAVAP